MTSHFDLAASAYDTEFTYSEIGKKQRQMVYRFLENKLEFWNDILEVNCGTGADAAWFGRHEKRVLATDISKEMIKIAQAKASSFNMKDIHFRTLDITKIETIETDNKYDLIFSNFGGLNCLSTQELLQFLDIAKNKLLKKNGSIVMVIMSKGSVWESLFFLRKLDFKNAFRRNTDDALMVNVNGTKVPTFYYNPSFFKKTKLSYTIEAIRNIGFFLPPSYLEPIFAKRPRLLNLLATLEKKMNKLSFLASFSDHYLIELKPR